MNNFKKSMLISVLAGILLFSGCATQPKDIPITTDGITTSADDTLESVETSSEAIETDVITSTKEEETRQPFIFTNETATAVEVGSRNCDQLGKWDQSSDPQFPENFYGIYPNIPEEKIEKDYNNIEVSLGWTEYKKDSLIQIRYENLNEKYIVCYQIPYLEKYDTESKSWIRVPYCPDIIYYATDPWQSLMQDSGTYLFNPYYLYEPLMQTGRYRFILFIGPKVLYSPEFNIVDG